ncbi:hypothetical protein HYT25_01840 [Candidatus Pacearchaeota archaeon]|nr:hypothetical protein [Candidatus Pacearchaeota archaeon]
MNKKKIIKAILPSGILKIYRDFKLFDFKIKMIEEQIKNNWLLDRIPEIDNQKEMMRRKEFKIYSQTGEDGIIDYIFKKIGVINKTFIEIGIEEGKECNTANLSLNFGWKGVLIEANPDYVKKAKEYYKNKPVKVVQSFVTAENINDTIKNSNIKGEIDLLSIDIDGNDYWVWNVINVIKPRVVIIEYNSILGKDPITIKYKPQFERFKEHINGFYYGASLSALNKLGESKGYILVGCNSYGFNAFFVRKEEAQNIFHKLSPEEADYLPDGEKITKKSFEKIKHMEFERV